MSAYMAMLLTVTIVPDTNLVLGVDCYCGGNTLGSP